MDLVDGKIGGSNTWFKGLLGEFQKYVRYSIHPKARLSGFQMVISRTLFVSGIQMVRQSNGRDRTQKSRFQMVY